MGYSLKRLSIFHKSVLKNVKYVCICFFFFLEKVKILSCEFQLPGTNSHCVSTAVAFLVFLICLVDQMILLIGIVTSVLPIIDSFVFAVVTRTPISQWLVTTKVLCFLLPLYESYSLLGSFRLSSAWLDSRNLLFLDPD